MKELIMKKAINTVIKDFKIGSKNRFYNKVGWLEVERRVIDVFDEVIVELGEEQDILGRLYIESTRDKNEFKASKYTVVDVRNSIHIWTGHKILGPLEVDNYTKTITEKNAQMVFMQGPYGGITVLLSPYESTIRRVIEKDIIIGNYESTNQLTKKEIRKLFVCYLKYCFASSLESLSHKPIKNHIFRKWLQFKDFRNKTANNVKFFKFIEKMLLILLGIGAILATVWSVQPK